MTSPSFTASVRKMSAVLLLGVSSGLPYFLVGKTLQAWLSSAGVDLGKIGLFALASVPYSFKFLWAPVLDRFAPPLLGRRRGWMLGSQLLLAVAIAAMGLCDPHRNLLLLAVATLFTAFFSATQDVALDAWRVDVLEEHERGNGASLGVLGYRLSLLLTGSAALILADHLPWPTIYLGLAGFQILLATTTFWAPDPARPATAPRTLKESVIQPFLDFAARLGGKQLGLALGFLVFFKFGVFLVVNQSTQFLLDIGYTQTDVGTVLGGAGLFATILGTLAGGVLVSRLGALRSLWIFGLLQVACNLPFWFLALHGHVPTVDPASSLAFWERLACDSTYRLMAGAVVGENFFVGMGTAALTAWIMGLCHPRYSATQFALLTSLMAFGRDLLTSPAGYVAKYFGWPGFFLLTIVAALPGMILLVLLSRTSRRDLSSTT